MIKNNDSSLILENISKNFGEQKILKNINLKLGENHTPYQVSICGPSGSGKSSLLYLIGGLETSSEGRILAYQNQLCKLSEEELAIYRNRVVGFVFQFHHLLPTLSGLENIYLPYHIGNHLNKAASMSFKDLQEWVQFLGQQLNILKVWNKLPSQLSGGEQQRINFIRALSLKPRLLLCDEPTGNLDTHHSEIVTEMLLKYTSELKMDLILVTHDTLLAEKFKHRLYMRDGVIEKNIYQQLSL
jgi:lipoprotein-releasing system ATP-binding protein